MSNSKQNLNKEKSNNIQRTNIFDGKPQQGLQYLFRQQQNKNKPSFQNNTTPPPPPEDQDNTTPEKQKEQIKAQENQIMQKKTQQKVQQQNKNNPAKTQEGQQQQEINNKNNIKNSMISTEVTNQKNQEEPNNSTEAKEQYKQAKALNEAAKQQQKNTENAVKTAAQQQNNNNEKPSVIENNLNNALIANNHATDNVVATQGLVNEAAKKLNAMQNNNNPMLIPQVPKSLTQQKTNIKPLFSNIKLQKTDIFNANTNRRIGNNLNQMYNVNNFYEKLQTENYSIMAIYNEYKNVFNTFVDFSHQTNYIYTYNNNDYIYNLNYKYENIYKFLSSYINLLKAESRANKTIQDNIYTLICSIILNNRTLSYHYEYDNRTNENKKKKYILIEDDEKINFNQSNQNITNYPIQDIKHTYDNHFSICDFMNYIKTTYSDKDYLYVSLSEFIGKYNSVKNSLLLILLKSCLVDDFTWYDISKLDKRYTMYLKDALEHLHFDIGADKLIVNFDDFFIALTIHNININSHSDIFKKLKPYELTEKSFSECDDIIDSILINNYDLTFSIMVLSKYMISHLYNNTQHNGLYPAFIVLNIISCFERQINHEAIKLGSTNLYGYNIANNILFILKSLENNQSIEYNINKSYNYPFMKLLNKLYKIFIDYNIENLQKRQNESITGILEFVKYIIDLLIDNKNIDFIYQNRDIYHNSIIYLKKNENFEVIFNKFITYSASATDILYDKEYNKFDTTYDMMKYYDKEKIFDKQHFVDYHINIIHNNNYDVKYEIDGLILNNFLLSVMLHKSSYTLLNGEKIKDNVKPLNYQYIPNLYIKYNTTLTVKDYSEIFTNFFKNLKIEKLNNKNLIIDIKLKDDNKISTFISVNFNIEKKYLDIYIPYINEKVNKSVVISLNDYLTTEFINFYNSLFKTNLTNKNTIINSSFDKNNELYYLINKNRVINIFNNIDIIIPIYTFIYNYVRIVFYNNNSLSMVYINELINNYIERFSDDFIFLIPFMMMWLSLQRDVEKFINVQDYKLHKLSNNFTDEFRKPKQLTENGDNLINVFINIRNDRFNHKIIFIELLNILYNTHNVNLDDISYNLYSTNTDASELASLYSPPPLNQMVNNDVNDSTFYGNSYY